MISFNTLKSFWPRENLLRARRLLLLNILYGLFCLAGLKMRLIPLTPAWILVMGGIQSALLSAGAYFFFRDDDAGRALFFALAFGIGLFLLFCRSFYVVA